MPESYYFVAPLSQGNDVGSFSSMPQVNFSGFTIANVGPAFSMAGWIRITQLQQEVELFNSPYQFVLKINPDGHLNAFFITPTVVSVVSPNFISDTNWHFVAVSFSPTGEGSGTLSVYLDGAPSHLLVTIPTMVSPRYDCVLGNDDDAFITYLDVASWEIWNIALTDELLEVPKWGVPNLSNPDRTGLVAAFDFASKVMTTSSQTVTFTSSGRGVMWPCLKMGVGYATPQRTTQYPIGNSGSWTLLTWIKVTPNGTGGFIVYSGGGIGSPGQHSYFNIVIDLSGGVAVIKVVSCFPPSNEVVLVQAQSNLADWSQLGVTCDGQIIRLFVNGVLLGSSGSNTFTNSFSSSSFALSTAMEEATWVGSLQSLSIWNIALTADQITANNDWIQEDTAGLVAFFPFLGDTSDTVNGVDLNVVNGVLYSDMQLSQGGTTVYQSQNQQLETVSSALAKSILVSPENLLKVAKERGISVSSSSISEAIDGDTSGWLQKAFSAMPEPERTEMLQKFGHDYNIGLQLGKKGVKEGRVEWKIEDGHTVFYYHTLNDGPVEVYREEFILTPQEGWIIVIVLDVLFVFFAMFGVATSPTAARTALTTRTRLSYVFPQLTAALQNIPPGTTGAITIIGTVMNVLSQGGIIFAFIWNIITASWWSLIFVVVSLIASIFSAIFLPASYGWRLANVGIAVGTLAYDLTQKPPPAVIEK